MSGRVLVRRHPSGGWTHAHRCGVRPAWIYRGWWATRRAAVRALAELFSEIS